MGPDHLLRLVLRLGPLMDKLVPTCTRGVRSLLGAGNMSLFRTPESKLPLPGLSFLRDYAEFREK